MKFWQRIRRVFLRARINDIEDALWKDGRRGRLFGILQGSIEERLDDLNEKINLLAAHQGVEFRSTYKTQRHELISKEQADAERRDERDLWR